MTALEKLEAFKKLSERFDAEFLNLLAKELEGKNAEFWEARLEKLLKESE